MERRLERRPARFTYTGAKTKEISFPLGGIGSGSIGLAGNGRLIDWEIFNRPNKGGLNGFSHFAVKAEAGGKVLDTRILHGDLLPPYSGSPTGDSYAGFGFGNTRQFLSGLTHFREVEFRGEFPLARLDFRERKFPGRVSMTAFNPFIPLNDRDSSLPAAFFEFEVRNTSRRAITYTIAGTLCNPFPAASLNRARRSGRTTLLHLTTDGLPAADVKYGDLALATDAKEASYQEYWFRSEPDWFNNLEVYWHDLTAPGPLRNRRYPREKAGAESHGTIAARVRVGPGKTERVRFLICWNVPNCENYWEPKAGEWAAEAGVSPTWRNYYATLFDDAAATARYGLKEWDRLHEETKLFKEALFSSDLPPAALDAVSANLSILKSPIALRLEDGTFYGWEGGNATSGCCEGTCTHVWNYAQALPFLFPKLERSVREADFAHNQSPAGGMSFRMRLPIGSGRWGFRPCADGQFGGVLKTYREWKICGDTEWLSKLWPAVKKSVEFAWSPENEDRWDPEKTGVLHGRQHHTLDMELFGPNSWLTGLYLGALKAAAEMADHLGEEATAREYTDLFERGRAWAEEHLFNGEYYHQLVDVTDRSITDGFGTSDSYWDGEHGEIKHQIGEGCGLDQILAQWHADLYGLGDIFDRRRVKKALRSVFKYNFKTSLRDFPNPCRVYSLNDEAGIVICDWPTGRRRPVVPVPYASETWNGFEYAAAAHMIHAGLVRQGMRAVEAARDRYDGERRNPWNEFECGSNYARSMASYALLNVFSGFTFDMSRQAIGFDPVRPEEGKFRCFWSLDSGWGLFEMRPGQVKLRVLYGSLPVKVLELPFLRGRTVTGVRLGKQRVEFGERGGRIELTKPARLHPEAALVVTTRR